VALIKPLGEKVPKIAPSVFIAETAVIVGDVEIDENASIWYGAVLRGDVGRIRIGKRSNIQDLACIHMTGGLSNTDVADDVTIGHGAIIHGGSIARGALIGMGSVVLDNAEIGEEAIVAGQAQVLDQAPDREAIRNFTELAVHGQLHRALA
jgi:carbonic anhydrase/acetyltransferase-like protein (isoleucine patch superfamily)